MNLEKCLIYLNVIQKSIKKSKLSPFDYFILERLIEIQDVNEQYIYTQKFINKLSKETGLGKTKILTSLKKLNEKNFISRTRAIHDERCTYLSVNEQQKALYINLKISVQNQVAKL